MKNSEKQRCNKSAPGFISIVNLRKTRKRIALMKAMNFPNTYAFIAGVSSVLGILVTRNTFEGLFFGLTFGFFMAFLLKEEKLILQFSDRASFVAKLTVPIVELGYLPVFQSEQLLTFKPSTPFGYVIMVQIDNGQTIVSGPRLIIKKLQKKIPT